MNDAPKVPVKNSNSCPIHNISETFTTKLPTNKYKGIGLWCFLKSLYKSTAAKIKLPPINQISHEWSPIKLLPKKGKSVMIIGVAIQ